MKTMGKIDIKPQQNKTNNLCAYLAGCTVSGLGQIYEWLSQRGALRASLKEVSREFETANISLTCSCTNGRDGHRKQNQAWISSSACFTKRMVHPPVPNTNSKTKCAPSRWLWWYNIWGISINHYKVYQGTGLISIHTRWFCITR